MKRLLFIAALAASLSSCARVHRTSEEPSSRESALLESLVVSSPPAQMSDRERLTMEAAAIRVVAEGPSMVPALLHDLKTDRDPNRRAAEVRLLAMILSRVKDDSSREANDGTIERCAREMLASENASDRRLGLQLSALTKRNFLVPSALAMLSDADESNRGFAGAILKEVAQVDLGFESAAGEEARKAAVRRWERWWSKNRRKDFYYTAMADPITAAFGAEATEIARKAGPYALEVTDRKTGRPVPSAVVAYSYYFTTFDGAGQKHQERSATDEDGKFLLAAQTVAPGMKFIGADLLISKAGYRQEALRLTPHLLTPNSFTVSVALEEE